MAGTSMQDLEEDAQEENKRKIIPLKMNLHISVTYQKQPNMASRPNVVAGC
jgi:hypothetical protein